jgi:hypothetical protein
MKRVIERPRPYPGEAYYRTRMRTLIGIEIDDLYLLFQTLKDS